MVFFINLIFTYAPWIYFLCSLVALYQIYRVWLVRLERRQAVFALEREKAVRDLYRIFSVVLILLVVMGTTYFSSTVLADAMGVEPTADQPDQPTFELPDLDAALDTDTPIITVTNLLTDSTPLSTTDAVSGNPAAEGVADPATAVEPLTSTAPFTSAFVDPTPLPLPTATLPPTPAPVVAAPPPNCPDARNTISAPGVGQTVSGPLNLIGTATHEQFNYYKIEYAPPGVDDEDFAWLMENRAPVANSTLATVDTNQFSNGQWTLRVVVVDQSGNFINPPCSVTVNVLN